MRKKYTFATGKYINFNLKEVTLKTTNSYKVDITGLQSFQDQFRDGNILRNLFKSYQEANFKTYGNHHGTFFNLIMDHF